MLWKGYSSGVKNLVYDGIAPKEMVYFYDYSLLAFHAEIVEGFAALLEAQKMSFKFFINMSKFERNIIAVVNFVKLEVTT